MQIDVTYDASVAKAPAGFKDCVAAACAFFDATFAAPVTINIAVGYGEIAGTDMDGTAIGVSQDAAYFPATYAQLRNALIEQNAPGASTLPANDPTRLSLLMPNAEAKALGFVAADDPAIDGWIGISSIQSFSLDPNDRASPGKYDLIGTIEHEISEVMGRTSAVDSPGTYMALDLFRYAALGTRQLGDGGSSYFSVDGGRTSLNVFNNVTSGDPNGDLGDWAPSAAADSFREAAAPGSAITVTKNDITEMASIGWTTSAGTPTGTIAWSNANSDYTALPGGHFSVALPFASDTATLSLDNDGRSVDLSYANFLGGGSQVFTNVEFLQFTDKTVFVENADDANVARLYEAALGRAPDVPGLSGWENVYTTVSASAKAAGTFVSLAETPIAGLTSIASGFTNSAEFHQKYGALSDTAFVTQLYQNVLGRAPDQAGLDGWLNAMHQGDSSGQIYTREMVLVGFAESPENVAKTAGDWLFQT